MARSHFIAPSFVAALSVRMLRTVAVAVIMAMMIMRMAMMVMVSVRMAMTVIVVVIMVMDTLRRAPALHLLAEHQRLDGDRHGV